MKDSERKAMFASMKKQGNNPHLWNDKNRTTGSWKNVYKISPKNAQKLLEMKTGEKRIALVNKHDMPTHQVLKLSDKELHEHMHGTKKDQQIDQAINTYLNSWNIPFLIKEVNNEEEMTKGDFDSGAFMDDNEANEKIKVSYLGEENNMFHDVFPDGETENNEHVTFYDKLNDLKLPDGYSIYTRDGDVFLVKGW